MGKEREAMSVVRTLTALCVLYAATSMAHESDVMTFGSIVKLKEWADSDLNLSGPVSDGSLSHGSAHPKPQSKATDDGVVSLGESAPTEAVTQAKATPAPTEEAPAPVQVAAAPMVQGGAVKQFIWHVLGKNQPVSGPTAQPTLRGLLKQGVTLFNGGKMFFDVAKPAN